MPATSPKQAALNLVQRIADDASFEDIQYQLYVLQQIEAGLKDVGEGRTVSHTKAREHLSRWLDQGRPDEIDG